MNKFPLKFAFEGAFWRSWYIRKKNYLGYKIGTITCKIEDDGKLTIIEKIDDKVNFDDFDDSQNI